MIGGASGCALSDAYNGGAARRGGLENPNKLALEDASDAESDASDESKTDYTQKEIDNEKKAKPIVVDGKKYKMRYGSRRQVYNGTAYTTKGNLKQKDIIKNKQDRFVSRKKSRMAKKEQRLLKHGYGATKGKFGFTRTKKHTQDEIDAVVKKRYGDVILLAGRVQKRMRRKSKSQSKSQSQSQSHTAAKRRTRRKRKSKSKSKRKSKSQSQRK